MNGVMAAFVDFNRTALNRNGAAGFTAILICLSQGVALGGGRQAVRLKAVGERLKAVRLLGREDTMDLEPFPKRPFGFT